MMHAIVVKNDRSLRWTEVADPVRKASEVLLEIHAAALNRADLLQRAGNYPPPPGWPEYMGLEVAGTVLEAPSGGRWKPGDRVCALLGGGGYAERIALDPAMLMEIPGALSMVEAASLPEAYATSYLNWIQEGGLKTGDTVLVQAGASGLGIAAIQLAKFMGARVIATTGSDEKAEIARSFGADIAVNRRTGELGGVLDANPPDIVLDCAGGGMLARNFEKLAPGGRWILISTLGGEFADISLRPLLKRGLRLIGSTLRSRSPEQKAQILRSLEREVWPAVADKRIRPLIYQTFPVVRAEEAHAVLQRNENAGKVVLEVKS